MNALDSSNETSNWNSDAVPSGSHDPIIYTVNFGRNVEIQEVRIQFQGGFVAEECTAYTATEPCNGEIAWKELDNVHIEPEDVNEMQTFEMSGAPSSARKCTMLKLSFEASSDFYGRVTVYKLEIWGEDA
mmetsp:Transcript_21919/g.45267  ORF Transcript_21919/g.45267 Transcript_21919/m.45267 type:complete len:130 (+) Transcript_21919:527-916(+)